MFYKYIKFIIYFTSFCIEIKSDCSFFFLENYLVF